VLLHQHLTASDTATVAVTPLKSTMSTTTSVVQRDWENRDFVQNVQFNIMQITGSYFYSSVRVFFSLFFSLFFFFFFFLVFALCSVGCWMFATVVVL
jgi:predicted PurR-regulated permease PerM